MHSENGGGGGRECGSLRVKMNEYLVVPVIAGRRGAGAAFKHAERSA